MKISKPLALFLGAVTLWPILYFFAFLFLMFGAFLAASTHGNGGLMTKLFPVVFVAHLGTMVLTIAVAAFYVVHLLKSQRLVGERRILWLILILFGNVCSTPVYWYLYVWRTASGDDGEKPTVSPEEGAV